MRYCKRISFVINYVLISPEGHVFHAVYACKHVSGNYTELYRGIFAA